MSRWTITNLTSLSPQEIFDLVGYHILTTHNGQVRDVLIKPNSRPFAKRGWKYLIWRNHAPAYCGELIMRLDKIARGDRTHIARDLIACANDFGLKI